MDSMEKTTTRSLLLDKGIILQSGAICENKINLISGAMTTPLIETVWVFCDHDAEVMKRILCPEIYVNKLENYEYAYTSPFLEIDNICFKLVCDMRLFRSTPFENIRDLTPKFRIKHGLLVEIQSNIARHIGRPGILSLS